MCFHRDHTEKENRGCVPRGVAIVPSPEHVEAWKCAGPLPLMHIETDDLCGRLIGTCLKIKNRNSRIEQIKGDQKFLLFSLLYPVDDKEHTIFNEASSHLIQNTPRNDDEII